MNFETPVRYYYPSARSSLAGDSCATRVPLLIRTPDLPRSGVSSYGLVEIVDLYPTLATLAGLAAPLNLDGRSFTSVLDEPRAPGRDFVLSQFSRPWKATTPEIMGYSIRTADKRYTRWIQWQSRQVVAEELYDYAAPRSVTSHSPYLMERRNIAARQPELLERMRGQVAALLKSRVDPKREQRK